MNRRNLTLLFLLAALLGCFFQYARLDGFLHFGAVRNITLGDAATKQEPWAGADSVARDHYVIIYDPTDVPSMYARHNAEKMLAEQKKSYESYPFYEKEVQVPKETRGVILATGRLGAIAAMPDVLGYVADGGTAVLLQHPDPSEEIPEDVLEAFGIDNIGGNIDAAGVHFLTNFVIGLKDASFENGTIYSTAAKNLALAKDAETSMDASSCGRAASSACTATTISRWPLRAMAKMSTAMCHGRASRI